ncbi:uncharacterized protein LOC134281482 isoform X2 [Saccostrea cucullata]|uniref:uncharacterized protein LOC134281482 isoform X2 n=1 Tax=Saccostrea cuccullata TaxID=36930 RepID=UPI002ED4B970
MSETRKAMRAYNDEVDDSKYRGEDIRPCQTCKNGLIDECKGLKEEINKIQSNLLSKEVDINEEICDCQYGKTSFPVEMRPDGSRGRQNTEQGDSGYIESKDLEPKGTGFIKINRDEEGECVTLEGEGVQEEIQEENTSHA